MDCTMFNPHSQTYDENCFYEFYYLKDEFSYYQRFNQLLMSFMVFNVGLLISCWFSGKFLIDEVVEETKKEIPYKEKYPIDEMKKKLNTKTEINKNTVLMELTPEGNVLMRYNIDEEGFEYWCDNKNVKFDHLETVARKYVITNFCVELYKDRFKNIENQKREKEEKIKQAKINEELAEDDDIDRKIEEELNEDSDDDVFVKPKKIIETGKEKNMKKEPIVATESNKYIYMGKFGEFSWLTKPKVENKKKISYSDWFGIQ